MALLSGLAGPLCFAARSAGSETRPSLKRAMANLKVPPAWWNAVEPGYDLSKPWKEARLEIRRRLALGDLKSLREAMKLTVLYARKGDNGNGHELPMYLFIGGEHAWAIVEYEKFLKPTVNDPQKRGETHGFVCMAACYQHFGEHEKAISTCKVALMHLPEPPWTEMNAASAHAKLGDLEAELGHTALALQHYGKAIANYKVAKPKYGRHLLPRRIARVQSRIDLLGLSPLRSVRLRDGSYRASALGYNGPLTVIAKVKNGHLADVRVEHNEKIELGATRSVPRRILEKQDLGIDAVTGATVTSQAIVEGVLNALKRAGLSTASRRE